MLTACEFLSACAEAKFTASRYAQACLAEIEKSEPEIKAWAHLDLDEVQTQASVAEHQSDKLALQGVPIGIKDIIDIANAPCECGAAVFAGRMPDQDAELVCALRQAGAIIFGKTVTTEFAYLEKSQTRNPHHLDFSPGGSSSGSAAAVAAGHVPLAIGTQTGGSVIRPAAYCQVHAFKPTHTAISRFGIFETSKTLDQVGFFARSLDDLILLSSVLVGTPDRAELKPVSAPPRLLIWNGLYEGVVDDYVNDGISQIAKILGSAVVRKPAPHQQIAQFQAAHKTIYDYEISKNLSAIVDRHPAQVSKAASDVVSRGRQISDADYHAAMQTRQKAITFFAGIFSDYDALLSPSATGEAPLFENGTGNPACNTLWSLCGAPCLSLPLSGDVRIVGPNGLGVGLQVSGGVGQDEKILHTGLWLEAHLS